jgi:hypothetical protein
MNPMSAGWRDAFGNSFGSIVGAAESLIISAEGRREPFRYDQDLYPPLAIREAIQNLETRRKRKLDWPPVPATAEDLIWEELPLLIEIFAPSNHPIAQENARGSRQRIQAIEARYPGALARIEASNPGTLQAAGLQRKAAAA